MTETSQRGATMDGNVHVQLGRIEEKLDGVHERLNGQDTRLNSHSLDITELKRERDMRAGAANLLRLQYSLLGFVGFGGCAAIIRVLFFPFH